MKLLHIIKLKLAPESLARARKRVQKALKVGGNALLARDLFNQGTHGYYRDVRIYGGTK